MADQIVLAWTVDVAGTSFGPAQAAAALGAVPLYANPVTDPVLGALFGLTVADDATATAGSTATRTLTLNMNAANSPEAPSPFPARPVTSTPPTPPYPLRASKTLGGSFFVVNGLAVVETSRSQIQTLEPGDILQFLSQQGVFYEILSLTESEITLTSPYTGMTANTGAFQEVETPVTRAAIYSTSDLDTDLVASEPPILAGSGARKVELTYDDSLGNGPFTVEVELTGRRPAEVVLDGGSVDIATIIAMVVTDVGPFENSVGQLTLVELSEDLPALDSSGTPTPDKFRGQLTDEAQILIANALAYLPPSYFALAQQGSSQPPKLGGDFKVTTGSTRVVTTVDQTGVLAPGHVIRFASQLREREASPTVDAAATGEPWENVSIAYVVDEVGPRAITLTEPYTGIDDNFTGSQNPDSNSGTKGNLGSKVLEKATAAFLVSPASETPPTDDQLSTPLGRFVQTAVAGPPPAPPLNPVTIPTPTILSDIFTQTLQLALAVPVVPEPVAFLP